LHKLACHQILDSESKQAREWMQIGSSFCSSEKWQRSSASASESTTALTCQQEFLIILWLVGPLLGSTWKLTRGFSGNWALKFQPHVLEPRKGM
jgi:hypothetical protein